ncbi:MAG TPA: tRNA uridine-5-carboxymethylaminomethyl(34) synthesis GTPase MnmE [Thermodesulfobacteriota bacterium]|nr:tRNA uridine-5-carboxymethylaminomethyl(34) synthesis GTPase MnmE [Thermodesulfobacteriota bacterium]
MSLEDTIAAISTPIGVGGIGIIRISGLRAAPIAQSLLPGSNLNRSHTLTLGNLVDPISKTQVDQILFSIMRSPKTYTREDVVEINCHSGPLVLKKILELILSQGARLAQPGEFTLRAFLNGRIDLTQAEGIIELIHARSEVALEQANKLLQGDLREKLKALQEQLITLLAHLEAAIDFPEEELELLDRKDWACRLKQEVLTPLENLVRGYEQGRPFREGLTMVLLGKPNVGKSSLLNRLLKEDRAIVTPVPGTTRDTIEETILIKGLPIRLIDTAGIRRARDEIEEAGITRTREKILQAHLVLFLLDTSRPLEEIDYAIFEEIGARQTIILLNKMDLPSVISGTEIRKKFPGAPTLSISARLDLGLEGLKDEIHECFVQSHSPEALPDLIPTLLQKSVFEKMLSSLTLAYDSNAQGLSLEFIALDLQTALRDLGSLIGMTRDEDILDRIFSRFCIGK